jgi:predicted HTH transcriptional regulator
MALREVIFNAIIHKDYTGAPIQLSVYNDKLMLWNEVRLPEDFTIETLPGKHSSRPFNKNVADIFFKAGFIEAWGQGIAKITSGFKNEGLNIPVFETTMGGIMVTIERPGNEKNQTKKVQTKIIRTIKIIEDLDRIPEIYFKHLENTDGLYEIRIQLGSDIYRIFCFFDDKNIVVVGHGFQKKTQKTPSKEIEKAQKIRKEYYDEKK